MKNSAQTFLTREEQEKVTASVHQAEGLTSGEIVPMIVSSSHSYPLVAVVGAFFFTLPTSLLAARLIGSHYWLGSDNMWLFLVCFLVIFFPARGLINQLGWLKRFFLAAGSVEEEVQEAATTAFFTERLYRTKDENGILLYISVFERRVWILADAGINEKIPHERWQDIVNMVTTGIREQRQAEVICEAVSQIGSILQEFFPVASDDRNELHDLIIR